MKHPGVYILVAAAAILVIFTVGWFVKRMSPGKSEPAKLYQANTSTLPSPDGPDESVIYGKILFQKNCASCHALFKNDGDMMQVKGFASREPWTNRQNVYEWLRYPDSFAAKSKYKRMMREAYKGVRMTGFPDLTDTEIDAIIAYTNYAAEIAKRPYIE